MEVALLLKETPFKDGRGKVNDGEAGAKQ